MDTYIERVANDNRLAARMVLDQALDRLRLTVGLVEVVPSSESGTLPTRSLLRTRKGETPVKPARFVPLGNGRCVLVRDVE